MASIVQLPVFIDVPNWTEQVTLEGQAWTLRFHWNAREGYWYLHLSDEIGVEPIAGGRKLIPLLGDATSDELLRQLAAADVRRGDPAGTTVRSLCLFPEVFPGLLWAFAGSPLRREMADLSRMEILYADADAMAQLRAAALEAA